ncbi:RNP-1 like protein RNA-binding protein [Balamuthia mandrillaris]
MSYHRSPSPERRRGSRHSPERSRRSRSPVRGFRSQSRGLERDKRDSTTLFIGNLPYHMRERDLGREFERCGPIRQVTVGYNKRTGQSKGYAFVEYEHRRDAEDAYERYNGYNLDGRRLRIDWDVGLNRKQNFYGYGTDGSTRSRRSRSPRRSPRRSRRSPSPRGRSPRRSPRTRSPAPRSPPSPGGSSSSRAAEPRSPRSPRRGRSGSPYRRSPSPRSPRPRSATPTRSPRSPGDRKRSRSPPSRTPSPGADKRQRLINEED